MPHRRRRQHRQPLRQLGAHAGVRRRLGPVPNEPCFHRAGARRELHLDRLGREAEIFAPMVPLTDQTRGLVTAAHLEARPLDAPLLGRPNVVHTPHNAGRTRDANLRWAEALLERFAP